MSLVPGVSHVEVAEAGLLRQLVDEHGFTPVSATVVRHGATVVARNDSADRTPGLGLRTTDVRAAFARALACGGRAVVEPAGGRAAAVSGPGGLPYPLIPAPPGPERSPDPDGLVAWTQLVVPVGPGLLDDEMTFAERAFGFRPIVAARLVVDGDTVVTRVLQAPSGDDFLVLAERGGPRETGETPPRAANVPPGIRLVRTTTGELAESVQHVGTASAILASSAGEPDGGTRDPLVFAAEQAMCAAEVTLDTDTYSRLMSARGYVRSRTWIAVGTGHLAVRHSIPASGGEAG